jgi:hypothetical protein
MTIYIYIYERERGREIMVTYRAANDGGKGFVEVYT